MFGVAMLWLWSLFPSSLKIRTSISVRGVAILVDSHVRQIFTDHSVPNLIVSIFDGRKSVLQGKLNSSGLKDI